ncbi:MAG: extracellular solute-binding protein [Ruminococcaceae bacterium]|nr:extracellular solute-binding protein [Oscillospiraceae bacterium]
MKFFKKAVLLIMALIMLCTPLTACTGMSGGEGTDTTDDSDNTGKKYTLTIWGAQEDQELLKSMCAAYAKANPKNQYEFLFGVQGEGEATKKILNDVTSGPDVYSFASDQINSLYAGGALARVGGSLEKTVKEENSEGSVDAATININGEDQLYAYPTTADNCYFVYYDKRVFKNEDDLKSLDSMLDTAEAAGKKIHFKLNDDGWYLSSFFFALPKLGYNVTYDKNMLETAVDINYNSKEGLDVMKSLRSYVNRDGLVVQTDDSKMIAAFTPDKNGKTEAAAIISGTWNVSVVKDLLGDNMGVCPLPTANIGGKQVQLSGFMGYKLMGVNGYSKNKGEAHRLAAWLTSKDNQLLRFEKRGFAPTNKAAAAADKVTGDPVIATVLKQAEYNRAQKGVPANYWTPMASLITPLVAAKADGTKVSDAKLQEYLDALNNQLTKKAQ